MKNIWQWIRRELIHIFHELNPRSRKKAAQWEDTDGTDFFMRIGIKKEDVVMDFGCGPGRFCIPAAKLVGAYGKVYAVDKNIRILKKVLRKANDLGLQNLRTICSLTELAPRPKDRMFKFILLYDMLHFLDLPERKELYAALHSILAENGVLSVNIKHVKTDNPSKYFTTMTTEDVVREIETAGYCLSQKHSIKVWHAHDMVDGIIWNFVKRQ